VSPQDREDEIMTNLIVGFPFSNDILNGVNGQDNLIYGDSSGTLDPGTGSGNDTITGGANGTNTLIGDAETLMGAGSTGGNDTLIGGVNSINVLVGDANSTDGAPHGGNDTLIGGVGGSNTLIGDFVNRSGAASGGDDRLVSADNTTDSMWGDFQFISGNNNPQFGHDTFVFDRQNGNDTINDFHQGEDIIELDGFFNNPHIPTNAQVPLLPVQAGGQSRSGSGDIRGPEY
jgi:hypothetical protein